MNYNYQVGPSVQAVAQRTRLLQQLQDNQPWLEGEAITAVQQAIEQYAAGTLSWYEVIAMLWPEAS